MKSILTSSAKSIKFRIIMMHDDLTQHGCVGTEILLIGVLLIIIINYFVHDIYVTLTLCLIQILKLVK